MGRKTLTSWTHYCLFDPLFYSNPYVSKHHLEKRKTFQTILSKNTKNVCDSDLSCIVVYGIQQWSYYAVKLKNSVKVTSIANCKTGSCD